MLVPLIGAVLFFVVFYNFLNTRKPREFGARPDKGRNALIALVVSFAVFGLLWYLVWYLASRGLFGGTSALFPR